MVIFRENTEGAYVNVGGNFKRGTKAEGAVQEEIHTPLGVERIVRAAFEYAMAHGRREVLMGDKSNVMRYGHDLWQRVFEVARSIRDREPAHVSLPHSPCRWVKKLGSLAVIVTNNMFDDIITDLNSARFRQVWCRSLGQPPRPAAPQC